MDAESPKQMSFLDTDADDELETDTDAGDGSSAAKRRANELNGKDWTRYSISLWSDIRKSTAEAQLGHPAIFPIALPSRLIEIFTNAEQRVVLDPFAGVGSTIIAAQELGKQGIGIELNPEYAEIAQQRLQDKSLFGYQGGGSGKIHVANAIRVAELVEPESVDLVITSPPYWDILNMKRSADYKEIRSYSDEDADLGNIEDYHEFLRALQRIFEKVFAVMKPGAYCCVIVMDIRKKDKFYPFHSDIATFMQDVGFIYDDIIIWDRRHEYNNMRPLGYPYVFRVNKAHEFILIFQKPKE